MKKFLFFLFLALSSISSFAQKVAKPNIMVYPDREWCQARHYVDAVGNPDFNRALQDEEFQMCIVQFSGIMAERGYKLMDLSQTLEKYNSGKAKRMVMTGRNGETIQENDEDVLARAANIDIKILFNIKKQSFGGVNQVQFLVKAIDAATAENIWAEPFTPVKTSAPAATVLAQAVAGKMDSFCDGLQRHFDGMMDEGRKCYVEFNVAQNGEGLDFAKEYEYLDGDDHELGEILTAELTDCAVNNSVIPETTEDNCYSFTCQVPLFGRDMKGNEKGITAQEWVNNSIKKILKNLGIDAKVSAMGQGKVYVMLSPRSEKLN